MNQIPNCITCLNVLSGVISIFMASKGEEQVGSLTGIEWAWIFIGIAAIADFLDGFAARLLHAYSNLGKELDSLCDLVSFGVAPAAILHYSLEAAGQDNWVSWIPLVIPVAAALRLAKFNIDTRQTTTFLGLPVPANAIFWIGYSALALNDIPSFYQWCLLLPIALIISWLMLSEVKLFSLKIKSTAMSAIWRQLVLVVAAVVLVFSLGVGGLMWLILFYVGLSLATGSIRHYFC